jgi:hypothetical protein
VVIDLFYADLDPLDNQQLFNVIEQARKISSERRMAGCIDRVRL